MEAGLRLRSAAIAALSLGAAVLACGGSSTPSSPDPFAAVSFSYRAATATDPEVAAQFPNCVAGVGITHIHPSWRGFARIEITPVGAMEWRIDFSDVPVDAEQRIRISDPNACALNATGASTANVFANGTLLQRVVDTPGTGIEPGLAFTVDRNGNVSP